MTGTLITRHAFRVFSGSCSTGFEAAYRSSTLAVRWMLGQTGSSDVLESWSVARSVDYEVSPGLGEAEPIVGTAAALIGVVVVLAVIFPGAHGADLVVATSLKRQVPATRTCVRLAPRRPIHVDEHAGDCHIRRAPLTTTLPWLPNSPGHCPSVIGLR